jgi:arabinofuranosyltransferase
MHDMTGRKRTGWIAFALCVPFLPVLLLHARRYFPFISDDALISLRYAARLLEGHGLTWTDGHRVEGYSNLLWILLVALPGAFGVDLVLASRVMGLAGMAAAMLTLSWWYARQDPPRVSWFPVALALLFLALAAPIAVWAIGGLEQPLYAALIAASIPAIFSVLESKDAARSRVLRLSLVLGLLCLTRPDGPIFTVTALATLLAAGWMSGRRTARAAVLVLTCPVACYAGQMLFRFAYYGELVPNSALVKLTPSHAHWIEGLNYLRGGLTALAPLSVLALASMAALLASRRARARGIYLALTAIVWSGYVVFIGGDIFPAYRHFVPLVIVLAFALAEGARMVSTGLASRPVALYATAALALALCIPYGRSQLSDKHSRRAIRERWEWQGRELGLVLKSAFGGQRPLLAVTAAGCLPYWSELPSLDMLGLNDYYLPRHPPADIGTGMLGHELGDGLYVLGRRPDIIVFNIGSPPSYRSGEELNRMEAFHARYVPVPVRTPPYEEVPTVYFDRYSGRIGITVSQTTIAIPGFLLTGPGTVAQLTPGNNLAAAVPGGRSATIAFTPEPADGWVVDHVRVPTAVVTAGMMREDGTLTVTVQNPSSSPAVIEEIVLKRRS